MLDLILRLIDRCIDLLKRREESDRRLFNDLIVPAFSDFETLHNNYLDRFQKYREVILTSEEILHPKHPLFDQILVDNLFTESYRAKVWELRNHVADPILGTFIAAIIGYILFDRRRGKLIGEMQLTHNAFAQVIARATRQEMLKRIEKLSREQSRRQEAIDTLDRTVAIMQENYALVVQEYMKLKNKLLRKK